MNKVFSKIIFTLFILFLVVPGANSISKAEGSIIYVSASGCSNYTPCFSTVQDAIDYALPSTVIKVAAGKYTGNGLQVAYIDKPITMIGGFTSDNWEAPNTSNQTIIDGEKVKGRRGIIVNVDNANRVNLSNIKIENTIIPPYSFGAGISITKGTVNISSVEVANNIVETDGNQTGGGAGVFVETGQVIIEQSNFHNNIVENYGAGGSIYIKSGEIIIRSSKFFSNQGRVGSAIFVFDQNAKVLIENNIFEDNFAGDEGTISVRSGEVAIVLNQFSTNYASYGGAVSIMSGNIRIANNVMESNSAGRGGAISLGNGVVTVEENIIKGNNASVEAGAIFVAHGKFEILHNQVVENQSQGIGGAISTVSYVGELLLQNNKISANQSLENGAALFIDGGNISSEGNLYQNNVSANGDGGGIFIKTGTLTSQNDILTDNSSSWAGIALVGGSYNGNHLTIANNGSYAIQNNGGSATITNAIVAGHSVSGFSGQNVFADFVLFKNNLSNCASGALCNNLMVGDPKFVNPNVGNYHLSAGSLAIDKGISSSVVSDIDGEPRPMQKGIDLGADELPPLALFQSNSPIKLESKLQVDNISVSGSSTSFTWDFGDNSSSNEINPEHAYEIEGRYLVTLIVNSLEGTSNTSHEIIVDGSAPSGSVLVQGHERYVKLKIIAFDEFTSVTDMQISNSNEFSKSEWITFTNEMDWDMGQSNKVYIRFRDLVGNISTVFFDERDPQIFLPFVIR